jgi:hypothetical protein
MAEWSEDHAAVIGFLKLNAWFKCWSLVKNGDRAGPLGKWGDSWLGRLGSGYVANQHLQGCSPHLCRLGTVRLAPMSKY